MNPYKTNYFRYGPVIEALRGKPRAGYTTSKRKGTPKRKRKIAAASRKRNRR